MFTDTTVIADIHTAAFAGAFVDTSMIDDPFDATAIFFAAEIISAKPAARIISTKYTVPKN